MLQSAISVDGRECDVTLKDPSEHALNELTPISRNGHHAEPRDIWKARQFIEENAGEPLSLGKVASVIGINPTHLSEKFKQVTGSKFVEYIARKRFERARMLLQNVDLRISEIAFAVGFQSLSQFNRVFKKFSGTSPTECRAHIARGKKN
jgi:AraC-like DNA-binding protein